MAEESLLFEHWFWGQETDLAFLCVHLVVPNGSEQRGEEAGGHTKL